MLVRIYTYSTIKSIRPTKGVSLYVLATEIGDSEATLQGQISFRENPKEKSEREKASDKHSQLITALEAIKRLNMKCDALEIYTDSTYLLTAFEAGWLEKWKRSDWKDAHGQEIAHKELWQEIDSKLSEIGVTPIFHLKEKHPWTGWFEREGRHIIEQWKTTEKSSTTSTTDGTKHSA